MAAKPAPGGSGEIASVVLLMCIGVVMHPSQIAGGGFAKVSPDGPVNGADFVQAGGVRAVVDAMANHAAHNAELAERTCQMLTAVVHEEPRLTAAKGTEKAHAAGAVAQIVSAMSAHPAVATLQAHAARTLVNLVGTGVRPNPEYVRIMTLAGALQLLLCALDNHAGSRDVCRDVLRALGNMCTQWLGPLRTDAQEDILCTIARAAIKAAGEHAASAAVCGNAALVLVNMSAFDAVEAGGISALDKVIGLGGGVKIACSVLRDHLGDSDVVSKALVLLGNATAKGFHPVVCQHGGQELVRKALKTHPRNQTIQDYANRALALLELKGDARQRVRQQQDADTAARGGLRNVEVHYGNHEAGGGVDLCKS